MSSSKVIEKAADFAIRWTIGLQKANAFATFIPKNACSTLRFSAAIFNGFIADASEIGWIHNNNMAFNIDLDMVAGAGYSFVFLRSPYSRLRSVFLDKFIGELPSSLAFIRKIGDGSSVEKITFSRFIRYLATDSTILRLNPHWRPQSDFLILHKYSRYFAVEEMDVAVEILSNQLNFDLVDTRHLLNHSTNRFSEATVENAWDMPVQELRRIRAEEGIIPDLESLFSEELKRVVSRTYAEDFAVYEREIGLNLTLT